ncbi:SMP-30/gluconolactonase/LRE family protein [Curtobacterium sp. 24E2]|nr:SMP-30/gluconolactonase/LRE family protein [Curtobacterium sp. 24E2]
MHITLDSATDIVISGIRFPEGNRWHEGRLWYSDMHTGEVFSVDPGSTDGPRLEATVDGQSSGLGWLADGRLIVSSMESRTVVAVDDRGEASVFADLSGEESSLLNDLVVDEATGRTYIGAFGYDLYGGEELRPGPLWVLEQDGSFRLAAEGLVFPNSANVLPGTRTLVVSETWGGRLTAFDIEPDGSLTGRREWAALPGESRRTAARSTATAPSGSARSTRGSSSGCSRAARSRTGSTRRGCVRSTARSGARTAARSTWRRRTATTRRRRRRRVRGGSVRCGWPCRVGDRRPGCPLIAVGARSVRGCTHGARHQGRTMRATSHQAVRAPHQRTGWRERAARPADHVVTRAAMPIAMPTTPEPRHNGITSPRPMLAPPPSGP